MALKIKIDAVDAEVKNLTGSFAALNKFAIEAAKTNSVWNKYTEHAENALKIAQRIQNLVTVEGEKVRDSNTGMSRFNTAANAATRIFANLGRETKAVASNLVRITYSFMNLGLMTVVGAGVGLFGLGLGLAGAGFYGMENMAARMGYGRRQALGLGTNFGGLQSFGTNLGRFVDPDAMLGNVFTGRYDITSKQRLSLMIAGVSMAGDTTDQAAQLLGRVPQLLSGTPEGLLKTRAQTLGILDVLSMEDVQRIMQAKPEERAEVIRRYKEDRGKMGVPDAVLKAWADMDRQIESVGRMLEAKFATGFAPLAEPLTHLSNAFEDRVLQIINSTFTKDNVERLAGGIKKFASYLGGKDFQEGMKRFVEGLSYLTPIVAKLVKIAEVVAKTGWQGLRILFDPNYNPTPGQALVGTGIPGLALDFLRDAQARARRHQWERNSEITDPGREHSPLRRRSQFGADRSNEPAYPPPSGKWGEGINWRGPPNTLNEMMRGGLERMHALHGGFTVNATTNDRHVAGSQHWSGNAADINTRGMSQAEYERLITDAAKAGFRRFGISSTHLHIDMGNPGQRRVFAFHDKGGASGNAGARSVSEWNEYLNAVADREAARRGAIYQGVGRRRKLPGPTSLLGTLASAARVPKRMTVENETNLVDISHSRVYG